MAGVDPAHRPDEVARSVEVIRIYLSFFRSISISIYETIHPPSTVSGLMGAMVAGDVAGVDPAHRPMRRSPRPGAAQAPELQRCLLLYLIVNTV